MTARFYDGQHAAPHAVSVEIEAGVIYIRLADGRVAERWRASHIRAVPMPDETVTFRNGTGLSRLQVDDPAVLAALRPAVRPWRRRSVGWRAGLAAAAVAVVVAVTLVAVAPGLLAPLVPPAWEAAAGRGAVKAMIGSHRVCTAAAGQRALDRFVQRLADTAGLRPIRLLVVDDPTVNAFSLPGRWILLERGLIETMEDGDELAGVLGHEAGHIAHHDPAKGLIRQLGLVVVETALGANGLSGGGVAGLLLRLSYTRSDEAAADAFSVATLKAAGLRADGLSRFFAHMADRWPDGVAFLSDHPATATRRAMVHEPAEGAPAFGAAEWQAIRTMCTEG